MAVRGRSRQKGSGRQQEFDPGSPRLHRHHAKPNVVVAPFRLEPQPEGRSTRPALVTPGAAPADARSAAGPIWRCRILRAVEVGIDTAGQFRLVPVAAPLED